MIILGEHKSFSVLHPFTLTVRDQEMGRCKRLRPYDSFASRRRTGPISLGPRWYSRRRTLLGHSARSGSSSGSAVAVAAGLSPLSLASETDGSITYPASRASLFGMKLTAGVLSTEGTLPLSPLTHSIGGMTKTATDLFALTGALIETHYMRNSWERRRVI